jgi:hypothetical protein
VKRFAVFFILSVYLVSATELGQLMKFPLLIEHYLEHQGEKKDLSVWTFLYMHYGLENDHDGDYEKDMKLPFKSHESGNYNYYSATYTQFALQIFNDIFEGNYPINSYYKDKFLISSYLSSIWQPPKFC